MVLYPKKGSRKLGAMRIENVLRTSVWDIRQAIRRCDLVVGGGGNIFQDETSQRSFWYYDFLARYALKKHKPLVLLGHGFGKISRGYHYKRLKAILAHPLCTAILRDQVSYRYALRYCSNARMGTDLGYGFLQNKEKPAGGSGKLGIMLKTPWPNIEKMVPIFHSEGIREIELMVSHAREELEIHSELEKRLKPIIPTNLRMGDINEITDTIASCDWLISERLHGGIVASYFQVPFLIHKTPKMSSYFRGFQSFFREKCPTEIAFALSKSRDRQYRIHNNDFVRIQEERYEMMLQWIEEITKDFQEKIAVHF